MTSLSGWRCNESDFGGSTAQACITAHMGGFGCNPTPWDWAVLAGTRRDDDRQKPLQDMTERDSLVLAGSQSV